MRRTGASLAVGVLVALLPPDAALACKPSPEPPPLVLSSARVPPGGTVTVSGVVSRKVNECPAPGPSTAPVRARREVTLWLFGPLRDGAFADRRPLVRFTAGEAFTVRVRTPADAAAGRYELTANSAYFGRARLDVAETLPRTGRTPGGLLRVAAGLLAAGVGALVAAARQPRRGPVA